MRPIQFLASIGAITLAALPAQAMAQQTTTSQPPAVIASAPLPDPMQLNKMIWSTMIAVHNANASGNYSVLRDTSAPGFQRNNNAAQLSQLFAGLRNNRIDLSNTLLLTPSFTQGMNYISQDMFRVQGYFGLRPSIVTFDLYYQWVENSWRLNGISLGQRELAAIQPEPPKASSSNRRRN